MNFRWVIITEKLTKPNYVFFRSLYYVSLNVGNSIIEVLLTRLLFSGINWFLTFSLFFQPLFYFFFKDIIPDTLYSYQVFGFLLITIVNLLRVVRFLTWFSFIKSLLNIVDEDLFDEFCLIFNINLYLLEWLRDFIERITKNLNICLVFVFWK